MLVAPLALTALAGCSEEPKLSAEAERGRQIYQSQCIACHNPDPSQPGPIGPAVRGSSAVAKTFSGRAQAARLALVDGAMGAAWALGGQPRAVFGFTIAGGKIVEIEILADPKTLRQLDVKFLNETASAGWTRP